MKLTVLGGDGARSTFLAKSLVYNAYRIDLAGAVFLDNFTDNLATFGETTHYASSTIRLDIQFNITTDPVAALQDANYTITTLRVGSDGSRIRSEYIVPQYDTLGQETTDAGGFAMVMRSIPAILRYRRLIEGHTIGDVILFSFTNPSGLVAEAIVKSGFKRRAHGVCGAPSELVRELPAILGCEERDLNVECYGLNHFSWPTHFTVRGEEVTERLIAGPELYQKTAMQYFSPEPMRLCDNRFLNEYLYYYYYREVALRAVREAGGTHGEQIACISQEMCGALRTVDTRAQPEVAFTIWTQHCLRRENSYMQNELQQEKFRTREPLTLRQFTEGPGIDGYAGVVLDILEAVNNITTKRIVVPIQNHDTFDFLHPDDMIEIGRDLSRDSSEPMTPVRVPMA